MEEKKMSKALYKSGFWTTVIFIVLKCIGLATWSWWFLLVTLFCSPVAWVCGIVWLIQIIVGVA